VEIGPEAAQFLFWGYLFLNFGILTLQCSLIAFDVVTTQKCRRPWKSMYAAGVAKYIAVSFDTSPATSLYLAGWPRLEFIQTGQLRAAGGHTPQTNPFP